MRESDRDLLAVTLEALVPLRIFELRNAGDAERMRLAREASQEVAAHGDVIQFRGKRRGETANAVGWLVTGLAVGAYQPGGVRFMGLAWCAAHPAHRWEPREPVCGQCAAAESPSPAAPVAAPAAAVPCG